ncbi:MAG: hypothetical protein KC931_01695 [Candidatus Omnitrophica bacterium]|nr:hypothetical protein [Candidatus Omnitrophota bacterium]
MQKKRIKSVKAYLCLFIILWFIGESSKASPFEGGLFDSVYPQSGPGFEFSFGGLEPDELYVVVYNGVFAGIVKSDSLGRLTLPSLAAYTQVEVRKYIHSKSAVSNWNLYD